MGKSIFEKAFEIFILFLFVVFIALSTFGIIYMTKVTINNPKCQARYGKDYYYNPWRGEPYCVNEKTGDGKWDI